MLERWNWNDHHTRNRPCLEWAALRISADFGFDDGGGSVGDGCSSNCVLIILWRGDTDDNIALESGMWFKAGVDDDWGDCSTLKEFIGCEGAEFISTETVNGSCGWICAYVSDPLVYKSTGLFGSSIAAYISSTQMGITFIQICSTLAVKFSSHLSHQTQLHNGNQSFLFAELGHFVFSFVQ